MRYEIDSHSGVVITKCRNARPDPVAVTPLPRAAREADKKKRLGEEGAKPKRIRYKPD